MGDLALAGRGLRFNALARDSTWSGWPLSLVACASVALERTRGNYSYEVTYSSRRQWSLTMW